MREPLLRQDERRPTHAASQLASTVQVKNQIASRSAGGGRTKRQPSLAASRNRALCKNRMSPTLRAAVALVAAASGASAQHCTTQAEFADLLGQVETGCCDGAGQEGNCDSGNVRVCDARCAPLFHTFWLACASYVTGGTNLGAFVRQEFVATHGQCLALLEADVVHDTDLLKPGAQHDASTPLAVTTNCHDRVMLNAGNLNTTAGPTNSVWMVGVKDLPGMDVHDAKKTIVSTLHARYGDCVIPPAPPPGEMGHNLVSPVVNVMGTGSPAGHTSYQLALHLKTGTTAGEFTASFH